MLYHASPVRFQKLPQEKGRLHDGMARCRPIDVTINGTFLPISRVVYIM